MAYEPHFCHPYTSGKVAALPVEALGAAAAAAAAAPLRDDPHPKSRLAESYAL
jgi:hypothetical protein